MKPDNVVNNTRLVSSYLQFTSEVTSSQICIKWTSSRVVRSANGSSLNQVTYIGHGLNSGSAEPVQKFVVQRKQLERETERVQAVEPVQLIPSLNFDGAIDPKNSRLCTSGKLPSSIIIFVIFITTITFLIPLGLDRYWYRVSVSADTYLSIGADANSPVARLPVSTVNTKLST